ncbi:aldo/keto reductase [Streptomyces sp. NPDC007991]|uniref:aldo/keto reductase n=1 Tax=Streptomyces sp. NPDC007991 TaxID=3364803 RepID=UPI0036E803E8
MAPWAEGEGSAHDDDPGGAADHRKVGVARIEGEWRLDGRPDTLRDQVEQALRRLRVERIELLQPYRIAPGTPLADQLGTPRDLQAAGLVGRIGLSEVTVTEPARAREIVGIASVQHRYNLLDREHEPVLDTCATAGIAFLPWRPVAWGKAGAESETAAVAADLGATPTQVAHAGLPHRQGASDGSPARPGRRPHARVHGKGPTKAHASSDDPLFQSYGPPPRHSISSVSSTAVSVVGRPSRCSRSSTSKRL